MSVFTDKMSEMKTLNPESGGHGDGKIFMDTFKDDNDWEHITTRLSKVLRIKYILKLVIVELVVYLVLYYIINFVYRFALDADQQYRFTQV